MPATTARTAANRRNARKSTGPKTVEGKARSSMNALKHGLTAQDIVLPNEDPRALQQRLDAWNAYYRPVDPAQADLIDRAVTAKWRLDRCTRYETARLAETVRHAAGRYEVDRFARVEELGRRLIFEPIDRTAVPQVHDPVFKARIARRVADNPAVLTREMQQTAQGVDWLIARWVELGAMLDLHGYWHYPEKFRALYMLGRRPEDVLEDEVVQKLFLACNIAHPDTDEEDPHYFRFWDECFQAKMGLEGKPMYFYQTDAVKALAPKDPLTARARLWDVIGKELKRLRGLKADHLDALDAADRASAESRAMFDESPAAVLLRRYETACEREMHRSIADLMKLRKDHPPADVWEPSRNEANAEVETKEEVVSDPPVQPAADEAASVADTGPDVDPTPARPVPGPEPAVPAAV